MTPGTRECDEAGERTIDVAARQDAPCPVSGDSVAMTPAAETRAELAFTASFEAGAALKELGRTEDLAFSPDGSCIAVAAFGKNSIVVFGVTIVPSPRGAVVHLADVVEFRSPTLRRPHGLHFLDERTLIVANRGGEALILELPSRSPHGAMSALTALATIGSEAGHHVNTPGSVHAFPMGPQRYELLICNNYVHYVTRHVIERNGGVGLESHEILLRSGLRVPDGVAMDPEGRWIAVSNHDTHHVHLYDRSRSLNADSRPDGVLRGLNYPHGIRFVRGDDFILVADAGGPYVNVYARGRRAWRGDR